jgi:hypothetical protein
LPSAENPWSHAWTFFATVGCLQPEIADHFREAFPEFARPTRRDAGNSCLGMLGERRHPERSRISGGAKDPARIAPLGYIQRSVLA